MIKQKPHSNLVVRVFDGHDGTVHSLAAAVMIIRCGAVVDFDALDVVRVAKINFQPRIRTILSVVRLAIQH